MAAQHGEAQLSLFDPDGVELQRAETRRESSRLVVVPSTPTGTRGQSAAGARLAEPVDASTAADVANDHQGGVYLVVEEVAQRLHCSKRTVHELTRTLAIPHRRLPGCRRCLFRKEDLDSWEAGAPLEVVEQSGGGRIVRPIVDRTTRQSGILVAAR